MKRTCAWCGWRDARSDDDEGKPICRECATPPENPGYPPSLAERVLALIQRFPGLALAELGNVFEFGEAEMNQLSVIMSRHIRYRRVRYEGGWNERRYYPTSKRADPRLDNRAPRT